MAMGLGACSTGHAINSNGTISRARRYAGQASMRAMSQLDVKMRYLTRCFCAKAARLPEASKLGRFTSRYTPVCHGPHTTVENTKSTFPTNLQTKTASHRLVSSDIQWIQGYFVIRTIPCQSSEIPKARRDQMQDVRLYFRCADEARNRAFLFECSHSFADPPFYFIAMSTAQARPRQTHGSLLKSTSHTRRRCANPHGVGGFFASRKLALGGAAFRGRASHRPTGCSSGERHATQFGPVSDEISRFVEDGLREKASLQAALDEFLTPSGSIPIMSPGKTSSPLFLSSSAAIARPSGCAQRSRTSIRASMPTVLLWAASSSA